MDQSVLTQNSKRPDKSLNVAPNPTPNKAIDQWRYVAEGHLNVTFTNLDGKIIRLRKEQRHIKMSKYNAFNFTKSDKF